MGWCATGGAGGDGSGVSGDTRRRSGADGRGILPQLLFRGQNLGKYKIVAPLGSGGFGTVYLAQDTWIGGSNVVPGDPSVVHHAIVFVDPKGEGMAKAGSESSYPCFGGPGATSVSSRNDLLSPTCMLNRVCVSAGS